MRVKIPLVFSCLILAACGPSPYQQITDAATTTKETQLHQKGQSSKCEPTRITGHGTDVVQVSDQAGCRFVTATCDGDRYFAVKGFNSQGEQVAVIVSEICGKDGYRWRKMWNPRRENYEYIQVDADEGWALDID